MSDTTPQFGTAEYQPKSGSETCKSCQQPLTGRYYRINGSQACEACTEKLKGQLPRDSHSAFVRGLVFGVGGAIIGLALYAAFGIFTGLVIGYVSLAVGWIVGKAIKLGSSGIGGRRYQIVAALLTYAAVSMAAIPMGISEIIKDKKTASPQQAQPASVDSPAAEPSATVVSDDAAPSSRTAKPQINWATALGALALVGLASPFLALQDPLHGAIGLVILFVGIRIAWQLTAGPKVEVLGPFTVGAASPPPPIG